MNIANVSPPGWFAPLLSQRPLCMTVEQWQACMAGVRTAAMADRSYRKRLERGSLSYCEGCTPEFRLGLSSPDLCRPGVIHWERLEVVA